jgi:hypothetical protein
MVGRLLVEQENIEATDGIFEADLVRSRSFEIIGKEKNVIALRDASGFDVLLTVACEEIAKARTAAIDAARLDREELMTNLQVRSSACTPANSECRTRGRVSSARQAGNCL